MSKLQQIYNTPPWDRPKTAATLFLATLQNPDGDEADRLLAAEMAGSFTAINDDLAEALLEIVEDERESEELRSRAIISFGPILEYIYVDMNEFAEVDEYNDCAVTEAMYQRIIKSLRELYFAGNVSELIRRRTLEASVRSPQVWHPGSVRALYQSGKDNLVITAVFCMSYIKGFQQEILEALQSKVSEIKDEALHAVGNLDTTDAWPDISDLLSDPDTEPELLFAAIDATVNIEHHEAVAALHELLERSSDNDDIVDTVYEALAMLDELFQERE